MKKTIAILLVLCLCICLCACDTKLTESTEKETTASIQEGNTYILTALNAKITVAEEYNVYALNSGFTEQMCQAQGIASADRMTQYLQVSSYDMYILPKEDSFSDPSFLISVRIKDKDYGYENFKDVNATEFNQLAAALVAGFGVSEYTVYENDTAKYVVFNCKIAEDECRYATLLDGKMVYFIVQTDGKTAPADHHARVCTILDSLKVQ